MSSKEASARRPLRLALVVQRYGDEVNGGAEYLARTNAERLAQDPRVGSVHVLTTCARDHLTWGPHYAPGRSELRGVTVERFANVRRLPTLGLGPVLRAVAQPVWFFLQGPFSLPLLRRLREAHAHDEFDAYIFYTYLYATTVFGLPLVRDRAMLVPTAHDETPIHNTTFRLLFRLPRAYGFLTPEERGFMERTFAIGRIPSAIVGTGIDLHQRDLHPPTELPTEPFVTYLGRIESTKGCGRLFDAFLRFKERHASATFEARDGRTYHGRDLKLVVAGRVTDVPIPQHPDVVHLGFVSEEEKASVLAQAEALFMPSWYESLSLVLLEAWALGCPALVDAHCDATRGQTERSGGGRLYRDQDTFEASLLALLRDRAVARQHGEAGRRFVQEQYDWQAWADRFLGLVDRVVAAR